MNKEFCLLDEPWCPVRLADGRVVALGLLELFERSGEIVALAETSPPSLIAQYRLLLVITHRALTDALGKWTVKDRARWFRSGLPLDHIRAYLERWRDRFWLFHPGYPFMQVAALGTADETRDKFKPWTQIDLASASGNAPMVFDHSCDMKPIAIDAQRALGALLGFLQFTPGGLVKCLRDSDKAGALANTAAVLPVGESLARTLVMALHPSPRPAADTDLPCWEREPPTITELRGEPVLASGPNDRYTRLSRAVLLRFDGDGGVRYLHFAAGLALADDAQAPDPMACFRRGSAGPVRLSFVEGRALWRDLPALVIAEGDGSKSAAVVEEAIGLHRQLDPFESVHQPLLVAGLASDQAKLLRWRTEQIVLPTALLLEADRALDLTTRVAAAHALNGEMKRLATSMLAETLPTSSSKDTRTRARQILDAGPLSAVFFAEAERALPALLESIANASPDQTDTLWNTALRRAAENAWQAIVVGLGSSAAALRADALYWFRFRALLNKQVPNPQLSQSEKETES